MNNNKVSLLNGQTVNIVNDVSVRGSEDADEVIEVKSVKYRELVRQSKHVSDDDEDSGRIRYEYVAALHPLENYGNPFFSLIRQKAIHT